MQVRKLEREVGEPLLERVGKRAYTTRAGEIFLAHAGRAIPELDRASRSCRSCGGSWPAASGSGTSASFSIYLLPPFAAVPSRYPRPSSSSSRATRRRSRAPWSNELDVGMVSLPVRERELAVSRSSATSWSRSRRAGRAGRGAAHRERRARGSRDPVRARRAPPARDRRWFRRAGVSPRCRWSSATRRRSRSSSKRGSGCR